ncbi:MAG: hypothetical protein ICV66_10135 [Chitinophagaceae bacterium]|nr:hypothetical protein [Chitinophagaceae bacterium]
MPKKLLLYRIRTLIVISLIWVVFGIVFYINLIDEAIDLGVHVSLSQFAFWFGIIGFLITFALIFYLKPAFNHQPVWFALLVKLVITALLFFVIAFVLLLIYYVVHYRGTLQQYFYSFFTKIFQTQTFAIFIIDMGLMTLLSLVILEVIDKYGPGMFWSMLSGEYHTPKKENRIFIFLDMNASTAIAEQLGHEKYFRLLRRFYADITIPTLANDGEIYQYVGDEIVLSWLNTPENKIKSLKFLRNAFYLIKRRSDNYVQRFGHAPEFKAGVHAGEITAGFIGIIKRDLIYCGDTLNTTARIRSMCNELDEEFVLSEDFMHDFHQPFGYEIREIGKMDLKGRQEPIKLYSMKFES